MKRIIGILTVFMLVLLIFSGCPTKDSKPEVKETPKETPVRPTPTETTPTVPEVTESPVVVAPGTEKLEFVIKTDKGEMKGELYPDVAPNTVLNFVELSKKGFYNGLTFHRVVPGFVIQGGDPAGNGTGGPGYSIPAEFNARSHKLGALAMARSQHPDSAGSQFYICIADCKQLDRNYTVFGQVTEGMPAALSIEVGDKIQSVEIIGELPADLKDKEIKKSGER